MFTQKRQAVCTQKCLVKPDDIVYFCTQIIDEYYGHGKGKSIGATFVMDDVRNGEDGRCVYDIHLDLGLPVLHIAMRKNGQRFTARDNLLLIANIIQHIVKGGSNGNLL